MSIPKPAVAPLGARGAVKEVHQHFQETTAETVCRKQGNFPEVESLMPLLPSRKKAHLYDRLSSLLGEHNPLAHPVDAKDHTVWLFDNTASPVPGQKDQWKTEVVAAYFVKDSGDDTSEIVGKLCEILGIAKDDRTRQRIAERLQPFLDCVLPAHTVQLSIEGQTFKLGPSSSEGITSDIVKFRSDAKDGGKTIPSLIGIGSQTTPATNYAEETGWAVISDVDDTIKRTLTSSALGVLQSTFIDDPTPIEGMPELYSYMYKKLGKPPFWYLSASPYNLYKFLRTFILDTVKFPAGTIILRDASWMSLAGLLASVTQGTQAYKVDRMSKVQKQFPKRTFICIGDSTQSDPESYGQMYREHAGWIGAIFIRKVVGISEAQMDKDKNDPERFEKAFEGIPKEIWHVFEDPKELYEKVDEAIKRGLTTKAKRGWFS